MESPVEAVATATGSSYLETVKENKPFSQEELSIIWTEFTVKKRQENKSSEVVILNQEFTCIDNLITLTLSNPVQQEQLNNFKSELLLFLRERLQNYLINLEAVVNLQDEKKMIYTSSEKFNYLAGKNPTLLLLKQKLGLELDF